MNDNVTRRSPRKLILTIISIILILGIAAGATLAILSERSKGVSNSFSVAEYDVETKEDFEQGDMVKKDVYVKNDSSSGAYIRAAISVTWQNANGDVYPAAPVLGTDYTLTRSSTGWLDGKDGYYYWTSPVASGSKTENLIDECRTNGTAPEGYVLHVEIAAQAIQASPKQAVIDSWGVTVDADGRISK